MRNVLLTAACLAAFGAQACADSEVDRTLGARCDAVSDCEQRCLMPSRNTPGGMCSLSCTKNSDCPGDSVCADRDGGICLYPCKTETQCQFLGTGWYCEELEGKDVPKVMACYGE